MYIGYTVLSYALLAYACIAAINSLVGLLFADSTGDLTPYTSLDGDGVYSAVIDLMRF
jgi:hypothetical protein